MISLIIKNDIINDKNDKNDIINDKNDIKMM